METKNFGIDRVGGDENKEEKVFSITNDEHKFIRVDESRRGTPFSDYYHKKDNINSREEVKSYESVREEICDVFGIPMDKDHIWIREVEKPHQVEKPKQRIFRVFCVLLNTDENEGFYGEGRMRHKNVYDNLAKIAHEKGLDIGKNFKSLMGLINPGEIKTQNGWMWVKGFLSKDGFADMPERFRSKFEKMIIDENGQKYETPENWFISGGSIAS